MLHKSKIEMSSSRSFGIVFFIVFIIISLWPLTYDSQIRVWSMFIAIVFRMQSCLLRIGAINEPPSKRETGSPTFLVVRPSSD